MFTGGDTPGLWSLVLSLAVTLVRPARQGTPVRQACRQGVNWTGEGYPLAQEMGTSPDRTGVLPREDSGSVPPDRRREYPPDRTGVPSTSRQATLRVVQSHRRTFVFVLFTPVTSTALVMSSCPHYGMIFHRLM